MGNRYAILKTDQYTGQAVVALISSQTQTHVAKVLFESCPKSNGIVPPILTNNDVRVSIQILATVYTMPVI